MSTSFPANSILWILVLLSVGVTAKACDSGWFGSSCQYKCHCTGNNCDNNGDCIVDSGCVPGWFGPQCQYVDLTYSSTSAPKWLRDGDSRTCNENPNLGQARVVLQRTFPFTWCRIHVNNGDLVESVGIELLNNNSQPIECNNKRNSRVDSRTIDFYCEVSVEIKAVIVTGDGVGGLCSVYVSGGRNVALKQKAEQSSTYSTAGALKAVDGNTNQDFRNGSCTHTRGSSDSNPNWNVTFSHSCEVNRYVLYNRDLNQVRLKGFILTSLANNSQVFHYQDEKTTAQSVYTVTSVTNTSPITLVNIRATPSTDGHILTLCEVEIYGDVVCSSAKYGRECEHTCNCAVDEPCFVSTGGCPNGCAPGFMWERCNESCSQGHYGINCKQECSDRCASRECNAVTGRCDNCPSGFTGDFCDQNCDDTFFGPRCMHRCNNTCVEQLCNRTSGVCIDCPSGKMGDICDQECPETKYGPRCTEFCSNSCLDSKCYGTTGLCISCPPGYSGDLCKEECSPGTYGDNCLKTCGNCKDVADCSPIDGTCTNGCSDGYMESLCDAECENGTFGTDCKENCSMNCNTADIPEGQTPCHHVDGSCLFGCLQGYEGEQCLVSAKQGGDDSMPTGAIVGAIIAVLVIAALIVGGVLFWRRRQGQMKEGGNHTLTNNDKRSTSPRRKANTSDGIEYNMPKERNPYCNVEFATGSSQINIEAVKTQKETSKASKLEEIAKSGIVVYEPDSRSQKDSKNAMNVSRKESTGAHYVTMDNSNKTLTTTISASDLHAFVRATNKEDFKQQFQNIPANKEATTKVGLSEENKHKNRYKNIITYDHSRVCLQPHGDKPEGGYINASHVEGYQKKEKFIASQGPTKLMIEDFVRMLWEQQTEKVVMLTNLVEEGKLKCEKYWPDEEKIHFGDIKMVLISTEVFADYTIRRLKLCRKGHPDQLLTQFHFTSWPDKGVPTSPWGLVDFEQRVALYPTDKPIVVHCSAGVGRTGTFIALRNVMREAEDTGYVDCFATVQKLRKDRVNMVQTAEQYEFLHRAAHVAMGCLGTTVSSVDIQDRIVKLESKSKSGQTLMEAEFKAICDVCTEDAETAPKTKADKENVTTVVYENSDSVANKFIDRFKNVPAKEAYRAKLSCENDDMGDYINAVLVPSFRKLDQQILTQLPLPTTVTDFWRLVTQYKVALVVAFDKGCDDNDSSIAKYLPQKKGATVSVPLFNITSGAISRADVSEVQKLTVEAADVDKRRKSMPVFLTGQHQVTHLKFMGTDLNPKNVLKFVREIRSLYGESDGRVLYMCKNGFTYSGLVCVLTLLLDRMDHDFSLTVPLVVGTIKSIRPQVIPTLDQYRLLYHVLDLYNETNNVYVNTGEL